MLAGCRLVVDAIDRCAVDAAHGPAGRKRGDRQHRLHRDVQLAAEAAAGGRGICGPLRATPMTRATRRGPSSAPGCRRRSRCGRPRARRSPLRARCRHARQTTFRTRLRRWARPCSARCGSPLSTLPRASILSGLSACRAGAPVERRSHAGSGQRRPGDGQLAAERFHRLARADQGQHRFAAEPHQRRGPAPADLFDGRDRCRSRYSRSTCSCAHHRI